MDRKIQEEQLRQQHELQIQQNREQQMQQYQQQQLEQQQQQLLQQNQRNVPNIMPPATMAEAALGSSSGVQPAGDDVVPVGVLAPSSSVAGEGSSGKRGRGRPRKYANQEEAAAAKRARATATWSSSSNAGRNVAAVAPADVATQFNGNPGHDFTIHNLNVSEGEDIGQMIMALIQEMGRDLCIISAIGRISTASVVQLAASGGNMTYQGSFDIIRLNGSYIRTETGGRTGGISVTLCNSNGEIFGGNVGGPLRAGGPVQITVATFLNGINNTQVGTSSGGVPVSSNSMHAIPSRAAEWSGGEPSTSGSQYMTGMTGPGAQQPMKEEEDEGDEE